MSKNYDRKHLTTTQRIKIEKGLLDGDSFASIARTISKHPSTVAKEVKKYRYFPARDLPADRDLQCTYLRVKRKVNECMLFEMPLCGIMS